MHPLDVKISLSNEINVIRIECVKQKKSIFQFISPAFFSLPPHNSAAHHPLSLALGTPSFLYHLASHWHLLSQLCHSQVGKLSCDLDSGGSPKLIANPSIHICI